MVFFLIHCGQVRPGRDRPDPEAQAALHRDSGRGRDQPGAPQLHQGLRERARGRVALGRPFFTRRIWQHLSRTHPIRWPAILICFSGCARQGIRGGGFRPPPGSCRPHVRHPLRLHAVQNPARTTGVPQGGIPGAKMKKKIQIPGSIAALLHVFMLM